MQALNQYLQNKLSNIYSQNEISGLKKMILEYVVGWNFTQQQVYRDAVLDTRWIESIHHIISRLCDGEPVQYILGKTIFYDLPIKVTPDVLIPRQETEELVHWIIQENKMLQPNILDIGTGSGCIAIALKKYIDNALVFALDKSQKALEVAQSNARMNNVVITFQHVDILQWEDVQLGQFDIIVSNPPYVMEKEKAVMQKNVLNFEPQEALFITDENPLIFYKAIGKMAKRHLTVGGSLYFEINESLSEETKKLMEDLGYYNIKVKKDLNGKFRMLKCVMPTLEV